MVYHYCPKIRLLVDFGYGIATNGPNLKKWAKVYPRCTAFTKQIGAVRMNSNKHFKIAVMQRILHRLCIVP